MINIENVSIELGKDHRRASIIKDVSLQINDGEFVTIVGPSGCGKTTLLRAIAGLIPITSGSITLDGRPVKGPSRASAMVFQEFALLPWRSVQHNVETPLEFARVPKAERAERAKRALEQVHLGHALQLMPRQLSGGMKQRVGLARALATNAGILLMDEPFGAVDPQVKRLLQATLLELWRESSRTVVFVTHDIDEAVMLADRVICLGPGSIREVIDVTVPRPRLTEELEVRSSAEMAGYRDRVWKLLASDIRKASLAGVGESA